MADFLSTLRGVIQKRYKDMGDGTHAEVVSLGDDPAVAIDGEVAVVDDALSEIVEGQIASGESQTAVVDLGATYKMVRVVIPSCDGFDADTTLTAAVAPTDDEDYLADLYEENDPSTKWEKDPPNTDVSCTFVLTHAYGVRKIQFTADTATTGDVSIGVVGYGRVAQ